jgi:type IV secretory pathway component VirB8
VREVWLGYLQQFGIDRQIPTQEDSMQSWWMQARERFNKKDRKAFDTMVILISCRLWKQRNARVFQNQDKQYSV